MPGAFRASEHDASSSAGIPTLQADRGDGDTVTATATPPAITLVTGATVWLTGLPSSGKTTIARGVAAVLRADGQRVEVLDGDAVRETLSAGLGFSRADRETNIDRIGFVADLLARNGVLVLAAVISPYGAARDRVRARHARSGAPYLEVHVATPVQTCAARDVKGLYARQARGDL